MRNFTVFIAEITSRAFIIADSNKRRTLSRSDIAKALSKSDQFDFLIDIVPREPHQYFSAIGRGASGSGTRNDEEIRDLTAAATASETKPQLGAQGEAGNSSTEVLEQLESLLNGGPVPDV
ncbi:hypothetical protein D9758_008571 [Tetrapyrgos nigripes]|uniref:Transcription factor CBF/NF-Y/archaeal histone domain-containing protein n=1 Tax=Tetrapyrgos nigripes TaxID=182062 RepID=A0A8H5G5I7_9AGAR|nr:hypothetical protein D9758_008571 [Tetrapyrgos nigripes]